MKIYTVEKPKFHSKNIVLIINGGLLGGSLGILIVWILKDSFKVDLQQILFVALLSILSFFCFSFKNKWGWMLTVLPVFCHILVHFVHGAKANNLELIPSLLLLMVFNAVMAFANTNEYQQHFNLSRKGLLLMNFLAFGLSLLLVVVFRNFQI